MLSPRRTARLGMPRQRGFTLVELAITLALLAILLFAVTPEVTSMIANSRVRSSAESLQAGLQRARNEALRRNEQVTFWLLTTNISNTLDNSCALSSTATAWAVGRNDPSGKCVAANSETVDPLFIEKSIGGVAGAGVAISAFETDGTTAAARVAFDGFGRVVNASPIAMINLDNANSGNDFRPLRLQLSRNGSVRLCEPRVTDANDPRRC